MVALPKKTLRPKQTVAISVNDQPLGECHLDAKGQLLTQSFSSQRQIELDELVRVEYIVQKKHAHEKGQVYDMAQFLADLPRHFRTAYTAQRVPANSLALAAPFEYQRFDIATIPAAPRGKRHQP